ncbi:MAG: hypothetical protein KGI50_01870 [Patescibacteria group bacterium]|nr:hypothetical protein [Patescibacteria group bacterium]MDE2437908.1 hypothetical protein [Patescibacteria group bacterium]
MAQDYIFKEESDLEHYDASAFALRCFDNRFWIVFKHLIKGDETLDHIDLESTAGGAKVLASPEVESDREALLREIEKSVRLHHTPKVMLFNHIDCGAYGGSTRFNGNRDEELTFHVEELKRARAIVQERFPNLVVETYFIDEHGIMKIQ